MRKLFQRSRKYALTVSSLDRLEIDSKDLRGTCGGQDHVTELLTSSAEQRLARVLLRLAHLNRKGSPVAELPILSHRVLAEMVGTTRPRVNLFMNRFRKMGFIDYNGRIEVHKSLQKVLRRHV
jgi:CRP-like cAMP-binding protein